MHERQANANLPDIQGFNVLLSAAWNGQKVLVTWLLKHGSKYRELDLDAKGIPPRTSSCGGKGPFDAETWAARKGFNEICAAIRRAKVQRAETEGTLAA